MTKKERQYIENMIKQHEHWRLEEEAEYRKATTQEEKDEHYDQAKLHGSAEDTLHNLLINLDNLQQTKGGKAIIW